MSSSPRLSQDRHKRPQCFETKVYNQGPMTTLCDFKKHGTKSNLWRKQTTNRVIYSCWVRDTQGCKHLILFKMIPMAFCNAKDNQAHREVVCKQRILLLSCYAVTKSTLHLMFIRFIILIIEDAPIQANQQSAKGTFPQLRGTGRGIKRDILQRFFASVHGPFCRWSIGLLAVEKVESWRKKKKQTLSPWYWYFNDAFNWIHRHLDCFLESFGMFWTLFGCCWEGSCFNELAELDGCGSWQANVVTSLLLQKLRWIKSSKISSTSQQEKTEHLHAFKGGGIPSFVRFYLKEKSQSTPASKRSQQSLQTSTNRAFLYT